MVKIRANVLAHVYMFILSPASDQSTSQVLIPNYISIFFVISCCYFLVEMWRFKGTPILIGFKTINNDKLLLL